MSRAWPLRVGVLALALCFAPAGVAAGGEDALVGPVPDEMAALHAAVERFRARADELRAEALRAVASQRETQLAMITAAYDARIARMEAERSTERVAAISRLREFLVRYDDHAFGSEVRLRLAELLFQDANERWLTASKTYFQALQDADDLDLIARLEEQGEPKLDLTEVVALLTRVVEDNRTRAVGEQYALLDVAYYMLAFCYSEPNSVQYSRAQARAVFQDLVVARPQSEYADAAHLLLGNYAFDDNQLDAAVAEFQAVLARGPDQKHYTAALYQLAWSRYRLSQYDQAMALFVQLLDDSARGKALGQRASEFERDAVDYLALSLSDQADERNVSPMDRARQYFDTLAGGRREFEWAVLRSMAESLVRYARPLEAVEVYEYLQAREDFKLRPENPDFQAEVVRLLSRGYDADLKAAGEARLVMTERYGEGSPWYNANRDNPEAIAKAQRFIETSLLEVAIEVKVRAQEARDPALYSLAADKYREYLQKFPISDDYFANQYQLADALYQAGRFDEAGKEWADLLRNERFHPYGDTASYMLFRTRDQLMRDRIGPPDVRFAAAEVERSYTSVGGETITVYHLADDQKAFIEAADAVLARAYGPPSDGVDIQAIVDQNRVKIMYLPAQILYNANRFEEARPRLEAIFTQHPATDEAAWAANLLLNTYITEKDSAQIRRWSREFATMRLGASQTVVESKAQQFQDTLERATFDVGVQAAKAGDYEAAAVAYLAFAKEFPRSANVPVALLNAAGNYDRLGRVADANAIYERFIEEYPDHPEAKPYFFVIASNYEATFELEKAISIYRDLARRFPDYERAPDALYMVAFLQEGLGRKLEAAQGYEAYAKAYPSASDREEVVFRAGDLYEAVDLERAARFYTSYLAQYGVQNPDHALRAQDRLAVIYDQQGKTRQAAAARADVVKLFDRVVDAELPVGPAGRDAAAAAAFPALQAHYDRIAAFKLSRNEAKDAKLLTETMRQEVAALQAEAAAFVDRYRSFEWTTGALFLVAASEEAYAKLGLSVEPPAGLDEVDQTAYWELLETTFFPLFYGVEEEAVKDYLRVVSLAKETGRHSRFVDMAQAGLARLRPDDYPEGKQTLAVPIELSAPATLRPLTSKEVEASLPGAAAPESGGE